MKPQPKLGLLASCTLALAACATPTAPPPSPSPAAAMAGPAPAPVPCGAVSGPRGTARVSVQLGAVGCDEARALLAQYFTRLTPADLANPEGAGPIALGAWTCGSDPGAPLAASCSTEDDRQIASTPA